MTKKGSRGSAFGFTLTVFYWITLLAYIASQARFFFTKEADIYGSNIIKLNWEEEPAVKYEEF
jgi:hypothetical protein